jgi:NAD(P)-dependent dehydrogenase (short-subunit alcohol dehydrogenase family)
VEPWNVDLLHDRTVITGGGSGIGQALAVELARLGGTSYVLGRRENRLQQTVALSAGAAGRVVPIVCDVRDPQDVENAFLQVASDGGPAQALVHCALSVPGYIAAKDITPELFREVVDTVLIGAFNAIHGWSSALFKAELDGVAVALTSAIASRGTPGIAHSSAGKAGVEALVKSLAREWGPHGLRLNVVGPGFFPVERTRGMFDAGQPGAALVELTALQRLGKIEEVVGPIMFLLTSAASYITGQVLIPDGGFRLTPAVFPAWDFDRSDR